MNISKASYKTFTPAGTRDIDIKLREFTARYSPYVPYKERPDGYADIFRRPISRSLTYIPDASGGIAYGVGFQ